MGHASLSINFDTDGGGHRVSSHEHDEGGGFWGGLGEIAKWGGIAVAAAAVATVAMPGLLALPAIAGTMGVAGGAVGIAGGALGAVGSGLGMAAGAASAVGTAASFGLLGGTGAALAGAGIIAAGSYAVGEGIQALASPGQEQSQGHGRGA